MHFLVSRIIFCSKSQIFASLSTGTADINDKPTRKFLAHHIKTDYSLNSIKMLRQEPHLEQNFPRGILIRIYDLQALGIKDIKMKSFEKVPITRVYHFIITGFLVRLTLSNLKWSKYMPAKCVFICYRECINLIKIAAKSKILWRLKFSLKDKIIKILNIKY